MLRIILVLFLFSMACMGQTFQYSRGWTNGKRDGSSGVKTYYPATPTLQRYFNRDDDTLSEIFDGQQSKTENDRKLERCILQLQHLIRNPLLIRSTAPQSSTSSNSATSSMPANSLNPSNKNNNNNNSNNLNKINNNLLNRNHQNDLLEELTSSFLESNDYGKQ